jgi:hypothetical protein
MDSAFKTLNVPALAASLIDGWRKKELIQANVQKNSIARPGVKVKIPCSRVSLIFNVDPKKISVEGAKASF